MIPFSYKNKTRNNYDIHTEQGGLYSIYGSCESMAPSKNDQQSSRITNIV